MSLAAPPWALPTLISSQISVGKGFESPITPPLPPPWDLFFAQVGKKTLSPGKDRAENPESDFTQCEPVGFKARRFQWAGSMKANGNEEANRNESI